MLVLWGERSVMGALNPGLTQSFDSFDINTDNFEIESQITLHVV